MRSIDRGLIRTLTLCLALAGPALIPANGRAEMSPDPRALLLMLSVNAHKADYEGEKVVVDFSHQVPTVTRYRVKHLLPDLERKEYLDLGRVVIRQGGWLWNYSPEKELVIKKRVSSCEDADGLQHENLKLVLRNYRVDLNGVVPVLGRRSLVLSFNPLLQGSRPSRKVWMDAERGIPLRTEVYGSDGTLYLITNFKGIAFNPPGKGELFNVNFPGAKVVEDTSEAVSCQLGDRFTTSGHSQLWMPSDLPAGFILKNFLRRRTPAGIEYQHQYSDGLSALSFFQSEGGSCASARSKEQEQPVAVGVAQGALVNYGLLKMVRWNSDHWQFVVIGELAPDEMVRVARSVKRH